MAKVIILGGSGQVGGAAVRTLVLSDVFSQVVIGDLDIEKAQSLVEKINSEKLSAVKVDGSDPLSVKNAIMGCDMVVNCVGPFYKTMKPILTAVIESEINYVDVSDDVSVLDTVFQMDPSAKNAKITALVGLGFSPGVTNLMGKLASQLLDETDAIDIYHTHGGEPEEGAGVIAHRFHCMSVDCPVFLDGELKYVKFFEEDGMALREKVDFLGLEKGTPVYPYPHPEQVTMPNYIKVNRVTNKGSVLPNEYYDLTMDICRLGLNTTEPLEVKDQTVLPYDFSIAYIIKERERILEKTAFGIQRGASLVSIKGTKNGKPRQYLFKAFSSGGKHSGLGVATGIPAAVGAILMQQGKINQKGILPPEACVNPSDFFPLWEQMTALVTEKKKPFDSIVEIINEKGEHSITDIPSLYNS
ncbi:MAG: saccharopine dehydrogenase NADP-binding domain-containing protein [Chloroflexota bacterium]